MSVLTSRRWSLATRIDLAYRHRRYQISASISRAGRAWRLFTNRLTQDDGQELLYECQDIAGIWCLESFDIEQVLEAARDRWADKPELSDLASDAASRVAHKWSGSDGEAAGVAVDWALSLLGEYAEQRGIKLVSLDETEDEEEDEDE